jgi:dUTP pyrophosphatase
VVSPEPTGFHHVQLAMPRAREDEARAFYGGVLGLTEIPKPEQLAGRGGCWFRSDDGSVEMHMGVEDDFRPARKAHPALLVEDLDAVRARLEEAGVEVVDDEQLHGHIRFYAADPFGNRLELIERTSSLDVGNEGVQLPFRRLDPAARLPSRAHPGDAGFDLTSVMDVEVKAGERAMVPTAVAVAIPDGYAGLVLPRSGLASREGLTLANAPGLIDAGYRGEVTCAVVNLDRERPVLIRRGDRVAQLVIVAVPELTPGWVDELPPSDRGEGGFGSSGQ